MFLIFDTETTGLPKNYKGLPSDLQNWPRVVQLAWQLYDGEGSLVKQEDFIIYPEGYTIPLEASRIHGVTTERALQEGILLKEALIMFSEDVKKSKNIIAHNLSFDEPVIHAEFIRCELLFPFGDSIRTCTMLTTTEYCAIKTDRGFKWPALKELHKKLFDSEFSGAHDAKVDVAMCAKCFFELKRRSVL